MHGADKGTAIRLWSRVVAPTVITVGVRAHAEQAILPYRGGVARELRHRDAVADPSGAMLGGETSTLRGAWTRLRRSLGALRQRF